MTTFLRRAALAVTVLAASAVTVLSVGTPARAASGVLMSPKGEATILIDVEGINSFILDSKATCDDLTWDLNAARQNLGMRLGVSTDYCILIVQECVHEYFQGGRGPVMAMYVAADNVYQCLS